MRRRSTMIAGATVLALGVGLGACAPADDTPVLTWYTNPDAGGQAALAQQCTEEADGAYRIEVSVLPREASSQREQLARRLAASDSSIDLMSLDPPFIPELANAGFLAPVPDDIAEQVSQDVAEGALQGASWGDELVTVPFWANTQLLWFKKSVAEAAGLDMTQPVTWDQVIDAARDQDLTLGVQGIKAEAYTVWINALVESAGGHVVETPEAGAEDVELGLESDAGKEAARIIGEIGADRLGGAGLPTQDENASLSQFQGDSGSFMVNWPFVWPAMQGAVEDGTLEQEFLDDVGWAVYPQVVEGEDAAPPYGGINLGVGAFSNHVDEAYEAAACIVRPENQAAYFVSDGNPPASTVAYDDPEVQETFPMADVIRQSLEQAAPRPQTPYYNEVSQGLLETWHAPSSVDPETTPEESTTFIVEVLRGERLL
ncbi:sugar ABC transporter substrate-binding protein [Cellulomonas hominis]|uniref:sugar ABC transporter substrate-binding protein n=1 Tax=Cellulomonas hominis TaxID=156981 RepID=UPI0020BDB1F1|nr:extracellular solute-binding protein [Cellulomonas hominis]